MPISRSTSGGSKEDFLSMLQSPERKTPAPEDPMAKLKKAASTFPKTPSIIRHIPLTDTELNEVQSISGFELKNTHGQLLVMPTREVKTI